MTMIIIYVIIYLKMLMHVKSHYKLIVYRIKKILRLLNILLQYPPVE